ncbi:DUF3108 domain-containing protein [Pleionea sp. CnH1-48]|uniref:DUF3108 domain-containing protein n=1 Tax=Pleionea sp. CnH1-48 TaxID=2954494 RepID=UPI0020985579|nr:DUF3108 domain-containing protein [Pleionea sp. CnH1-48]MCO7222907.1 DUF3108 domain-containing protein [Pleionea sp. CnH1-48]
MLNAKYWRLMLTSGLILSFISAASANSPLFAYKAQYDILDGNDAVGTAERELNFVDGRWKLSMGTRISRFMFSYKYHEVSEFDQLKGQSFRSHNYYSLRDQSFKSPRETKAHFNWERKTESGSYRKDRWELPLADLIYDRLNYQLLLGLKMTPQLKELKIPVSYKGRHLEYHFINQGQKEIDTPMGKILAYQWDQQVPSPNDKHVKLWLSPEFGNQLVQMIQIKKQKVQGTLKIKSFERLEQKP